MFLPGIHQWLGTNAALCQGALLALKWYEQWRKGLFQEISKRTHGPRTPKPEYPIAQSNFFRGPLGFGPIQFLMDPWLFTVFGGWTTTRLCGDYHKPKEPVFQGKYDGFFSRLICWNYPPKPRVTVTTRTIRPICYRCKDDFLKKSWNKFWKHQINTSTDEDKHETILGYSGFQINLDLDLIIQQSMQLAAQIYPLDGWYMGMISYYVHSG